MKSILEQAFAPFADPATEISFREIAPERIGFTLIRNGTTIQGTAHLGKDGGIIIASTPDRGTQTLATFLASVSMANLDELARTQVRMLHSLASNQAWISGPARVDDVTTSDSLASIQEIVSRPNAASRTHLLILDAPAGMGKTALVNRLALERARAYLSRKATSLVLVVSSRGRKLSRLNDAIAATLQDLRVGIYYPEIPTLVRHGLITLVIDGFDELVNSEGYHDAWYSMTELLESVSGGGKMVLSSRDTFFSEQEFIQRAQRGDQLGSGNLEFTFLRLLNWGQTHVRLLMGVSNVPEEKQDWAMEILNDSPLSLIGRPFFASRLAQYLLENESPSTKTLTGIAVDAFVERESKLLFPAKDQQQGKNLLARFFEELAVEMRQQERDWLDIDVVQFFLDLILEEQHIPSELRRALVHRASSVAFLDLTAEGGRGRRGFPHEVIRDHFAARRLVSTLATDISETERLLGLGTFGLDFSDAIVEALDYLKQQATPENIEQVYSITRKYNATDTVAMNGAALIFALVRRLESNAPITVQGLTVGHASLTGSVTPQLLLENCMITFLDLSALNATGCRFTNCVISRLRIDAGTIFSPTSLPSPMVLEYQDYEGESGISVIHSPARIRERLTASAAKEQAPNTMLISHGQRVFAELARRWVRRFYLDPTDHEDEPSFRDPAWPSIKETLEKYKRLTAKIQPTNGPRRELLHLLDAKSLLNRHHKDPQQQQLIESIWHELAQIN